MSSSSLFIVSNTGTNFLTFLGFTIPGHIHVTIFGPIPPVSKPNNIWAHIRANFKKMSKLLCVATTIQEHSYLKVALSGECFLTDCTSERLVPRMGAHVYLQCRWGWEVLIANMAQVLWQACKHTHNTPSDQASCIH